MTTKEFFRIYKPATSADMRRRDEGRLEGEFKGFAEKIYQFEILTEWTVDISCKWNRSKISFRQFGQRLNLNQVLAICASKGLEV